MRKSTNDMQMNVAGIRRNIKNIAHNYSEAQRKVREATSNDPWGPSSTIMAEIADLTYNVVAFSEIMQMIWKRLNDHGKNWRHVNKALILLEYLIKTGSEKVGQQCKENIYAIQTLKDFQHLEEGQDYGQTVRENAKQLVILLKDDDKLKNERTRAIKAKERFAQTVSGFGSDTTIESATSPKYPAFRGDWANKESVPTNLDLPRDIEIARPQTAGEEELQLQLALAMSREEAEQEEQKRKSDDVRLQLALSQSQQDFKKSQDKVHQSQLVDLLDERLDDTLSNYSPVDPWAIAQPPRPHTTSPWHPSSSKLTSASADPWQPNAGGAAAAAAATSVAPVKTDPWGLPTTNSPTSNLSPVNAGTGAVPKHDPWSPDSQSPSPDLDDFVVISNRIRPTSPKTNGNAVTTSTNNDPFELNLLGDSLPTAPNVTSSTATKKTPQSFLGENSALVNLDNLVTANKPNNPTAANPFSDPGIPQQPPRPVFNTQPPKPSINEIKQQNFAQFSSNSTVTSNAIDSFGVTSFGSATNRIHNPVPTQDPWAPANTLNGNGNNIWMKSNEPANPFLS